MRQSFVVVVILGLFLSACGLPAEMKGPARPEGREVRELSDTTSANGIDNVAVSDQAVPSGSTTESAAGEEAGSFLGNLWSRFFRSENTPVPADTGAAAETAPLPASRTSAWSAVKPVRDLPAFLGNNAETVLQICNLGTSCSGDVGNTHWMKEAGINSNDKKRALKWNVAGATVDGGLLEIARTPQGAAWPGKTIYTQAVAAGQFIFDFNAVFSSQPKATSAPAAPAPIRAANPVVSDPASVPAARSVRTGTTMTQSAGSTILKNIAAPAAKIDLRSLAIMQPVYYLRVVPMNGGKPAGKPSNEVKVSVTLPPDETTFQFFSPPKVYDLKIKDFQPLRAPDKGVCSHAMIVDVGGLVPQPGGVGFVQYEAGQRICPLSYKGVGEEAWYESLWNTLTSGVDWVSEAYNDLKSAVVDAVGSIACGGNEDCEAALAAGLDLGLVALGIPPTIPNFDQLMDEGFEYVASELSAAAGCPDAVCRALIKEGLKTALDSQKNPNPACMDKAAANGMGIEPLCLPAGVKAHWDPAATHRDAQITVTVTRNQTAVPSEQAIASTSYRLLISTFGKNAGSVGGKIINIEPYGKTLTINKPLEGEIFRYVVIPIPYLEKGQSIDIPVNLVATDYWVPGHKELMEGWTTVTYKDGWPQYQYNDWWRLYYGADMSMVAQIDGCQLYGGNDCIVSIDSRQVKLPLTLNP